MQAILYIIEELLEHRNIDYTLITKNNVFLLDNILYKVDEKEKIPKLHYEEACKNN